jgi:hypothetical protein
VNYTQFDIDYYHALVDQRDAEIERLKGQIDVRDAVISKLSGTVAEWRPLLSRAADRLETSADSDQEYVRTFIAELRKAAG